jgi:competence ComEA-like helix-hairpin-helix protein
VKKAFRSFVSFTKSERLGIWVLTACILFFLFVRITMPYWATPKTDTIAAKAMAEKWQELVAHQSRLYNNDDSLNAASFEDANDENGTPLPHLININTADSQTLVRLKGIGPKSAGKIIRWRSVHGPFHNLEQFRNLCYMPEKTFDLLKPHLVFQDSLSNKK